MSKGSLSRIKNKKAFDESFDRIFGKKKETQECFSCDKEFEPSDVNDRDEGWFCNECLTNPEE